MVNVLPAHPPHVYRRAVLPAAETQLWRSVPARDDGRGHVSPRAPVRPCEPKIGQFHLAVTRVQQVVRFQILGCGNSEAARVWRRTLRRCRLLLSIFVVLARFFKNRAGSGQHASHQTYQQHTVKLWQLYCVVRSQACVCHVASLSLGGVCSATDAERPLTQRGAGHSQRSITQSAEHIRTTRSSASQHDEPSILYHPKITRETRSCHQYAGRSSTFYINRH